MWQPYLQKLTERYNQADRISSTVCTQLAGFFEGRHVVLGSVQYTHSTVFMLVGIFIMEDDLQPC